MSVAARIASVVSTKDGFQLRLVDRTSRSVAGQTVLNVVNSDKATLEQLSGLVGCEIWGSANDIMLGDMRLAFRVGYTGIRLAFGWSVVLAEYKREQALEGAQDGPIE